MKVTELIQALSKIDGNLEVVCYTEDGHLLQEGRQFLLLNINDVEKSEAELCRVDEVPYLKFGKSELSETLALIEVTSDF